MEPRRGGPPAAGLFPDNPGPGVPASPEPASEQGWAGLPSRRCPACGGAPGLRDLLPVIGLPRRWGRCDDCGGRFRRRVPVVELVLAPALGFIAYQHGLGLHSAVLALYTGVLVYLALFDLEHSLLPNAIVLPAIPVFVALFPFTPLAEQWGIGQAYLVSLAGAGAGFGVMLLVYLLSQGRLGAGDVKLAALLGAALGLPQVFAGLALGFVIGGAAGLALLALGLKRRTDAIPFGPALAAGVLAVLLAGTGVYTWYLHLLA